MAHRAVGHVAMAARFIIAVTMIKVGNSCFLRRAASAHSLLLVNDISAATEHSGPLLELPGYRPVNGSLGLLAQGTQWYGDIFDQPVARTEDVGLAIFSGSRKAEWTLLACAVVLLMLVDLTCLRRITDGKEGAGMHLGLLGFWICCGIAFNCVVLVHSGHHKAIQWCSGYFLEWLLSMDNLFVFHLIFRVYATPKELLHKALFLGIGGAVLFRMCFFMALASLLDFIHWFRFVFGVLLIYSGVQAAREEDEETDISNLLVVRWLKKSLGTRLVEKYDLEDHQIFIVEDGEWRATLLVPVIFCLEVTDILFAVDSVSAKVAQIPDYYIAYSSSVLAMFGLRAMFFVIHDLVHVFELLKYGLCFILVFIGMELLVEDYVKLPTQVVCVVIVSVFLVCTVGSYAKNACVKRDSDNQSDSTASTLR